MKLGCMLVTHNNGTGSRAFDCTQVINGPDPCPTDFLTMVLDSYFATITSDWPFVVVDDGSTDDSQEIIQRYADKISHPVVNDGNCGLAPSMDMAAAVLFDQGCDVICRFDADIEFITPGWDIRLLRHFQMNPKTGVAGGIQFTPFGGLWAHGDMIIHPNGYTHVYGPHDRFLEHCKLFNQQPMAIGDVECDSIMGCLSAFRSAAYQRVGGLREEFYKCRGQTEDINLRLLLEGYRCVSLGGIRFFHRHCESRPKQAFTDQADSRNLSLAVWEHLWGWDKLKPDLSKIYEKYQGTYLVRNLAQQTNGEIVYIGP